MSHVSELTRCGDENRKQHTVTSRVVFSGQDSVPGLQWNHLGSEGFKAFYSYSILQAPETLFYY